MKIKQAFILSFLFLMSFSFLEAQTDDNSSGETLKDRNQDVQIQKGLYNSTSIGVLSGSSQNQQKAPFSFQSLMLYQFDKHLAAGVGLGIDFLEETYIPFVADCRYYLRGTRFSPFVYAQAGYSVTTENSADQQIIYNHYDIWPGTYPQPEEIKPQGGILLNSGFRVRHMFHNEFGLEISFAYRFQRLGYKYESNTRIIQDYNRLNIRIGILFR